MPQDSPTVFDGGWRLLNGQFPFRDFTLPNAIVPVLMQGALFSWFGVSWFVYCLHAAILNGFFCVLVYRLLRIFAGTRALAFSYGLLSGAVFYAPFGVPVQDQHSYFFSTLLVVLACAAVRSRETRVKQAVFLVLPALAVIAFLCKQIPAIFLVALAYVMLLITERTRLMQLARPTIVGVVVTSAILLALWTGLGIDGSLVKGYFFDLPREVGAQRLAALSGTRAAATLSSLPAQWALFLPVALVPCAVGCLALAAGILARGSPSAAATVRQRSRDATLPLVLAVAFVAISLLFVLLTNNLPANGVPLLIAALGLVHAAATSVLLPDPAAPHTLLRASLVVRTSAAIVLLGSSIWCAWNFDRSINSTRRVHDLHYSGNADTTPRDEVLKPLAFLVWAKPASYPGTLADFARVVRFFDGHQGNFLLLGDSSILYALTARPSVNPVLWFHPGQTLPGPESPLFPSFEERLLSALRNYRVRYLVLETTKTRHGRPGTWSGVNLATFPALQSLADKAGSVRKVFGPFTIIAIEGFDDPKGS